MNRFINCGINNLKLINICRHSCKKFQVLKNNIYLIAAKLLKLQVSKIIHFKLQ